MALWQTNPPPHHTHTPIHIPTFCVQTGVNRLWAPSSALQLGRRGARLTTACQVENGQKHSRKKLCFLVLRRNEEQWEALSGVWDPTFKIFRSVWDELELLHQDVCSFRYPSWALVILEASKDAHGVPTPAFSVTVPPQTIEVALSYKMIKAEIIYNNLSINSYVSDICLVDSKLQLKEVIERLWPLVGIRAGLRQSKVPHPSLVSLECKFHPLFP